MNTLLSTDILNIISIITMIAIIVAYSLAIFWNIKFLTVTKWQWYSTIKLNIIIYSSLFIVVFGYLLVKTVMGNPEDIAPFGIVFIRPIILLMGANIASGARQRYNYTKHGGQMWILRQNKS